MMMTTTTTTRTPHHELDLVVRDWGAPVRLWRLPGQVAVVRAPVVHPWRARLGGLVPGVLDEDVVAQHLAGLRVADLVDGAGAEAVLVLVPQALHSARGRTGVLV